MSRESARVSLKKEGVYFNFRKAIQLLDKKSKRNLFLVSTIQSLLSLLDLVGVALMGVLAAVSVKGIQSQAVGGKTESVIKILKLENFTFQNQVAILTLVATSLLVSRTILSVYFMRRILFFLSAKSGQISADLLARILTDKRHLMRGFTTQGILYSVTAGVTSITVGIIGASLTLISDTFLLVLIIAGLFIVDPVMAISTIGIFGSISLILYRLLYQRARELGAENAHLAIESNEKILEALSAYRESQVRHRTSYYISTIRNQRLGLARISAEMSFMPNISKYVLEISVVVGAVAIAAIQFVTQDAMHAISTLLVFLAAGTRVAPAILRAQQGAVQMKSSIGSAIETFDLMDKVSSTRHEADEIPEFNSVHLGFEPKVNIKDLTFRYSDDSEFALQGIDLEIQKGQVVALVGSSGSGKTTFADLMLGLLPLESGSIEISGASPTNAVEMWPGAIAYVPQNVYIANGSIRENIALGFDPDVTNDKHFWSCLEKAQLDQVVRNLPDGLDAEVGENGSKLSGGQRQRLGIARALFTLPRLVLLDEATSALDGQTELDISDALLKLRGDTTVILIAHRLASVRSADLVVYMREGKVEHVGTFDEVRNAVPDFENQAKLMGL